METNQLKLYSILAASKVLCLGRDTVKRLIAEGKIGYIEIGKSKKIPYQELVRFQSENLKRNPMRASEPLMSKAEIDQFLYGNRPKPTSLGGEEILARIMKKNKLS
jgi:excisionase family DNA binding protein